MPVLINRKQYLYDFIRLNEDWITHYFSIEEADRDLARNPVRVIVDGGYIFTLLKQEQVVGVCVTFPRLFVFQEVGFMLPVFSAVEL